MNKLSPVGHAFARLVTLLALCLAPAWLPAAPAYDAQVINPDLSGGLLLPDGKTLLLWGSDATILRSGDGTSWSHADTPGEVDLARVASNDDGSVLIAVGARGVVLRSQDAGRSWTPAHNSDDADLRTASHHAPSGAWIAAGARGRILLSTNGGKRWTALPSPLTTDLQTSFVDPRTQRLLVGGDEGVIGMSADGGTSWDVTRIAMPDPVTPVTSYRRFGDLLLATSALGRFLISKDDGASWDLLQAESTAYWTDAAFDAVHDSLVLVGHNGEVVRSADGGETWQLTAIENAGRRNYLAAVYFDDRSRSLLAVGEGGTVARSSDGGASWTQASADVREGLKGLLAARGRLVSFGNGGLVVSSTDSGAHWSRARSALELPLREIVVAPGGALLASSSLGDLIRSADGGRSWRPLAIAYPNVNTPPDLRMLLSAPADDVLIAAGPPGAILRSNADASAWQVVHWSAIEEERAFPSMLVDRQRNLLVAVEARGRLQVSRDGGLQWTAVQIDAPTDNWPFWQGAVHAASGTLLVAGKGGLAARSTDGAASWSRIDTGTDKDLYGSFADGSLMFLMGQDGTLLRSTDIGATWSSIASGSSQELRRMVRDGRSGALICFGAHGAIVRSSDAGLTWRAVPSGTDGVLRKALVEPGTGHLLLVGGQGTLRRSGDGGRSWQVLPTHSTRHFSSALAVPGSGDLLLVGERIVRLVRRSPH
jgi:photosystem II stability/assembly factor-like uncharacterized protein